mgnify:CR=1 FL=1
MIKKLRVLHMATTLRIEDVPNKLSHALKEVAPGSKVQISFMGGPRISFNYSGADATDQRMLQAFIEKIGEFGQVERSNGGHATLNIPYERHEEFARWVGGLNDRVTEQSKTGYQVQKKMLSDHPYVQPVFKILSSGHLLFGIKIEYPSLNAIPAHFEKEAKGKLGAHGMSGDYEKNLPDAHAIVVVTQDPEPEKYEVMVFGTHRMREASKVLQREAHPPVIESDGPGKRSLRNMPFPIARATSALPQVTLLSQEVEPENRFTAAALIAKGEKALGLV